MFSEKEAAHYLKCSVGLLRKWRRYGRGPAIVRLGRLVRYRQEDLVAFVEANIHER
jgi:excisionase family DNA binding protein